MEFPAITAVYAGLFGLLLLALSIWVVLGRLRFHVLIGDGGEAGLVKRIRAHANFTEYVPLILLLIGLLELRGHGDATIHMLAATLLLARLIHPIGMATPNGNRLQRLLRGPGALLTWAVLAIASILLVMPL